MGLTGENPGKARGLLAVDNLSTASVIAHEMKAPLATIRQLTLELEQHPPNSQEALRIIEQIRLLSERSLRLTSNLAKAERLQTTLFTTGPLNTQQLCREVVHEMTPLYKAHGKQLVLRRVKRVPLVTANPDLLRRIILNFTDNALKYSGEDGIVELYLQLLDEKQTVRIGVRDYGPALPTKLWRTLTQSTVVTQPVRARPDSSGLGLVIASQFARAIGGEVGAVRHRDGATFYVDMTVSKQLALL